MQDGQMKLEAFFREVQRIQALLITSHILPLQQREMHQSLVIYLVEDIMSILPTGQQGGLISGGKDTADRNYIEDVTISTTGNSQD